MTLLVTGAAGFIGANFVLDWLAQSDELVVNLDKLTYAGNLETLASLDGDARHIFVQGDIGDSGLAASLLAASLIAGDALPDELTRHGVNPAVVSPSRLR